MYIRPIEYHYFKKYGTTIRSVDDLTFLQDYDFRMVDIRDMPGNYLYVYAQPVYIEPADGIGILLLRDGDQPPEVFLFARPVCVNAGVAFCVLPYECEFSFYMYSQGGYVKQEYDVRVHIRSNFVKLSIDRIYTFLYMEENKNFVFKGERHPYWELMYVDKGEITSIVERRKFSLKQGDLIFYRPNEFHALSANKRSMVSFLNIAYSLRDEDDLFKRRIYRIDADIHALLQSMIQETNRTDDYSVDFIEANLKLMLLRLIRGDQHIETEAGKIYTAISTTDRHQLVDQAKRLVEQYLFDETLSVAEIARRLNVSTSYLYRVFVESTGTNVQTYINDAKLHKAKEMIAEGAYSISQISQRLNFCSSTYFSTKFKEKYDVTPREYSRAVYRK